MGYLFLVGFNIFLSMVVQQQVVFWSSCMSFYSAILPYIKTIPKKRKCKKAKWLSEEALQIAKRREAEGKGEKERYTHLNAEFQRISRRDKKTFLRDQCKEIEENNRMGKIRDLFMEKMMASHSSTLA